MLFCGLYGNHIHAYFEAPPYEVYIHKKIPSNDFAYKNCKILIVPSKPTGNSPTLPKCYRVNLWKKRDLHPLDILQVRNLPTAVWDSCGRRVQKSARTNSWTSRRPSTNINKHDIRLLGGGFTIFVFFFFHPSLKKPNLTHIVQRG